MMSTPLHKALALPRGFDLRGDWLPLCDPALGELVRERIANEVRQAELREEANALAATRRRGGQILQAGAAAPEPAVVTAARGLVARLRGTVEPAATDTAEPTQARPAAIQAELAALTAAHALLAEAERGERRRVAAALWPKADGAYRLAASAMVAAIAELARRHRDFAALAAPLGASGAIPNASRLSAAEALGDALAVGPAAGALGRLVQEAAAAGLGDAVVPLFPAA